MLKWGHAASAAGFSIAIYACSGLSEASAADMPFYGDPAPQTKVEFGTGWYIRGDLGGAFDKSPALLPDATYLANQTKINWAADIGSGYKFNNWFRADMTLGMFGPQHVSGAGATVNCPTGIDGLNDVVTQLPVGVFAVPNGCTPNEQSSLRKYLLLTNAYIDLGTWYGVTPFVGAGIGAAMLQQQGSVAYTNNSDGSPYRATLTLPAGYVPTFYSPPSGTGAQTILNPQPVYNYGAQNWDHSYRTTKYNFAWALMAGLAYNLTDNATIEVGYRYVNFGQITGIANSTGQPFTQSISAQEVRVGIRYLVD